MLALRPGVMVCYVGILSYSTIHYVGLVTYFLVALCPNVTLPYVGCVILLYYVSFFVQM